MTHLQLATKESPNIMPQVVAALNLLVSQGLKFWIAFWSNHWDVLEWRIPIHVELKCSLCQIGELEMNVSCFMEYS